MGRGEQHQSKAKHRKSQGISYDNMIFNILILLLICSFQRKHVWDLATLDQSVRLKKKGEIIGKKAWKLITWKKVLLMAANKTSEEMTPGLLPANVTVLRPKVWGPYNAQIINQQRRFIEKRRRANKIKLTILMLLNTPTFSINSMLFDSKKFLAPFYPPLTGSCCCRRNNRETL